MKLKFLKLWITLTSLDFMKFLKMNHDSFLSKSKVFKVNFRLCQGGELFDEIIARKRFTEADTAIVM